MTNKNIVITRSSDDADIQGVPRNMTIKGNANRTKN